MLRGGKLALLLGLWTFALPISQSAPGQPAGPPPVSLPFARVTAETIHETGTVTSIGSTSVAVWVAASGPGRALKIDPTGKADMQTVPLPGEPCGGLVADFGAVWIPLCSSKAIARVDIESRAVTTTAVNGLAPGGGALAVAVGSLWLLADDRGTLLRIDPDTGRSVADVYLPPGTAALAAGAGSIWAAGGTSDRVVRINPHTNLIEKSIAAPGAPSRIAVDDEAVWVLAGAGTSVLRIDPASGRVAATVELGVPAPGGALAAGEGSVWVTAPGAPLVRIDPRTSRVAQIFPGDGGGGALAAGHRSLWLAVAPSALWRIDPRFVAALR